MKNINWEALGQWLLEAWPILRGRPYKWISMALIGLAGLIIKDFWLPVALLVLGLISDEQAASWASPSNIQIIAAVILGAMAAIVSVLGMFLDHSPQNKNQPTVVALRHQSFEGNLNLLSKRDLPRKLKNARIIQVELDQSQFYKDGVMKAPEIALNIQSGAVIQAKGQLGVDNQPYLAYYGKAHIPFVFAMGWALPNSSVVPFELERDNGRWRALKEAGGDDLGLTVEHDGVGTEAVIRVSVSYLVGEDDVRAVVPEPYKDAHIQATNTEIDLIRSQGQVDEIATKFREVLDQFQRMEKQPERIHVFCAAPMSVVFALGRRVSPTIHPEVVIHNYTSSTTPRYSWAVALNNGDEPKIVKPRPPEQENEDVRSA